ncbi:MFS transporter [Mycobacterium sp. Aquia_213]|uniref:MFS transporter n=1 Tax=Mycobacterium sp. Aquia_213 TaxID=2991728 RepID=UPI002D1E465E|nr:MFS transporter [Mycobacterium sp. Aquia_213]
MAEPATPRPWAALWAMLTGYFMTLIDWTAVSVANPSIMTALHTDYDSVVWVTSAYLLGFAVPLLVAGRLGDQFGPKTIYLVGLAVFTAASLWCGLADSIQMLVAARVVQGVGAAFLTPQVLSMITRVFPSGRRGVATSLRGAVVGIATLAGPLAGGVLVDELDWHWIFFVNVPIGILAFGLGVWLIPVLPKSRHNFDVIGVLLSAVGLFLIVFALQEAPSQHGAPWIWGMFAAGLVTMAAFVCWQATNKGEPLIPLRVFSDRNYSVSSLGVGVLAFAWTAMALPFMFFAQLGCGLSAMHAAFLTAPLAVLTAVLTPVVGRVADRSDPRRVIGGGFAVLAISLAWLSLEMTPATPIWRLLLPFLAAGVGVVFLGAPLAVTAIRNLPPELAGAGSGVFTAARQVGTVLGSASMAGFMHWLVVRQLPIITGMNAGGPGLGVVPPARYRNEFAIAMSESMLLPAVVASLGVACALLLVGSQRPQGNSVPSESESVS